MSDYFRSVYIVLLAFSTSYSAWLSASQVACNNPSFETQPAQAQCHYELGQDFLESNATQLALESFENAVKLARGLAQSGLWSRSLDKMVFIHLRSGNIDGALSTVEDQFQLLTNQDLMSRAILLSLKGTILNRTGRLDDSEESLLEAKDLAISSPYPMLLSAIYNEIGVLNTLYDDQASARESFELALKHGDEGPKGMVLRILGNQLRLELQAGQKRNFDAKVKAIRNAMKRSTPEDGLLLGVARSLQQLSTLQQGKFSLSDEAARYLNKVVDQAENETIKMFALGYLGELFLEASSLEEALSLTFQAHDLSDSADLAGARYRWEWQLGRIYKNMNDHERAISAYEQSIRTLQPLQTALILSSPANFSSFVKPLYYEMADYLLQLNKEEIDLSRRQLNLRLVRDIIEGLKLAEVEDYFQDQCAVQQERKSLKQFDEHSAVIYPILFPERLELLLEDKEGLSQFTVDVSAGRVRQNAREMRLAIQNGLPSSDYLEKAQALHSWFVAPVSARLKKQQIDTLVVVPDEVLRIVPLSSFHDGNRFVGERFAVATTPGLTLTGAPRSGVADLSVMASGLTAGVQGFSPLPFVASELETIRKVYPGEVFKDEAFTLVHIEQALSTGPYSVMHIATHGQFKSDHSQSFLLTYDGKLTMKRLQRTVAMRQLQNNPLDLLVLSACQTAAGDERAALGLAGIALQSGVKSALATLWFINDEATSQVMDVFYQELKKGDVSKASALQVAQKKLISSERFSHPQYWAPFVLVGNWL